MNKMAIKPISFLGAVGFAGFGIYAAISIVDSHFKPKTVVQEAPLLQKVQALGDLHAVKYTYRDVHDFETTEEPTPFLSAFPGSQDLVHAVTRNTATMSYDATVEAGVDLTKAQVCRSTAGIKVVLPEPVVYPAAVSAQLNDLHRGLIWRDTSITLTALEDAKLRFRETSIRQGILEAAKKNIRNRILSLSKGLSQTPVVVDFKANSLS